LNFEIEIKLRLPDRLAPIRRHLRDLGFRVAKRRALETNVVFDDADRTLRRQDKLIRLRQVGGRSLLTYKGISQPGKHKRREEIEISLPDSGKLERILAQIGFQPVFRYEKFRTEYARQAEPGKLMLDETPIGNFLEIEGSPGWIESTAKGLGFSVKDYITLSYGNLYLVHCHEHGIRPDNMLFPGETPEASQGKTP